MKYSMMACSLGRAFPRGQRFDMKAAFELTASMGLDALDQTSLYGYPPDELRKMGDDHGVKIICFTTGASLAAPPGDKRTAALDQFKQIIDTALALNAPMVMLAIPGSPDTPREQSRKWAIESLARAVPLGKAAGVTVTIEHGTPVHFPFLRSDDMEEALQAIPDLMLTLDNGNVLTTGEDPVHAFNRHHQRTAFIHFKDWDRSLEGAWLTGLDGKPYRPALIGQGQIDYPAMMRALRAADYRGYLNLEYEDSRIPPFQAVRQAHEYLKSLEAQLDG